MRKKRHNRASPLRSIRRARTLNQTEIAHLLGIAQQTYSKYESGVLVPPFEQQLRLAAILGVPIETLFNQPANNPPQSEVA